ncbi:MAG: type VI secretion system protein [Desulfamplus sp.]|nr:type VI secretion system protein [Desulfamplus sp.]
MEIKLPDFGNTPISEKSPSGEDVRYEPDFEALSQEIAKLGSPTADSSTDWKRVIELSASILSSQSKNLQVATYYCCGMMKTQGIEGFFKGVHVLRELVENFWDTLFPPRKRMKGRLGIIEWWLEKSSNFITECDTVVWDSSHREQFIDDLATLDSLLGEKMEGAPLLRPLVNQIKSLVQAAPEPEPSEEPVDQPTYLAGKVKAGEDRSPPARTPPGDPSHGPGGPSHGNDASGEPGGTGGKGPSPSASGVLPGHGTSNIPAKAPAPGEPQIKPGPGEPRIKPGHHAPPSGTDSDMEPEKILKQGMAAIARSLAGLRQHNIFNPLPYRLGRIVAWTPVDALPTSTGGKTMLPPPDEQIVSAITRLHDSSNWEALIDACESRVTQYLFWLDLTRYVAGALENLGHPEISRLIAMETALYIQRLKGMENLSFSDGTPFADPGTKEWLVSIKTTPESSGEPGARDGEGQAGTGTKSSLLKQISLKTLEAEKLLRNNRIDEAVNKITSGLSTSRSGRERFLWRIALCRLLMTAKQTLVAMPHIDNILGTVDTYALMEWEPEIAVEALSVALMTLRLTRDDGHADLMEATLKRIALIDPLKALTFV